MSAPISTETSLHPSVPIPSQPPTSPSPTTPSASSNKTRRTSLIPFNFLTAKQSTLISAILRATSKETIPPPEPDVAEVLKGVGMGGNTVDKNTPIGAILKTLRTRFSNKNWAVILKSEILLHAIMRAGYKQFLLYLAEDLQGMLDIESRGEEEVGGVITGYAKYLKTWMEFRRKSAWFQDGMGRERNSNDWEKLGFDGVMEAIRKVLTVLGGVEDIIGGTNNEIVRVALMMVLHDCWLLAGYLKKGVVVLVAGVFGQDMKNAKKGKRVYATVLEVAKRVSKVMVSWKWVDENWKVEERLQYDDDILKEMNLYIEGGCIGIDNNPLFEATRRCIKGGYDAVDKKDLKMVRSVRCVEGVSTPEHDGGAAEVLRILVKGLESRDWRVVLKSFGLVFYLLGDGNGWLVDDLEIRLRNGELKEKSLDESIAGLQVHQELIKWCWGYLERLVKMKKIVGQETELGRELECFVKTMEWMVGLPVDIVVRATPICALVYEKVIVDSKMIFTGMARKANEMCGVFFESQEIVDAQRMLDVYGRFVSIREEVVSEDGLFSKMKDLDNCFRRPEEVVGGIEIYADMKMFVEMKMNEAGEVEVTPEEDEVTPEEDEITAEEDRITPQPRN